MRKEIIILLCVYFSLNMSVNRLNGQETNPEIDSLTALLDIKEGQEKVRILNNLSRLYWNRSYKTALEYSFRAYELASQISFFEGMSDATNRMGNIYYFLKDTATALDYYKKSLEIARAAGNERNKGIAYNNIGILYASVRNYEKAVFYYQLGLEAKIKHGDKPLIVSSIGNIGNSYYANKNYRKASEYYQQFTKIWEELKDTVNISRGYELLGNSAMMLGEYDKSLKYHTIAYNLRKEINDSLGMAQSIFRIGQNFLRTNRLEDARIHFNNSLKAANDLNHINLKRNIFYELPSLNEKEGRFADAYHNHLEYAKLNDSILKMEADALMHELKQIYETEFAEDQVSLLEKENEIQISLLKKEANLKNYLTIIVFLVLSITIIIISRYFLKQRLNNKLNEKIRKLEAANESLLESERSLQTMNATKDKFFGFIAHDLKNPFNALMGFSEMLSENFEDLTDEEISHYVEIINNSAKNLYRLLENLLLWSASQTGNINFAPEKFDLRVLSQKEISLIKNSIQKKNIHVVNKIAPGIVVYADIELISRVIANLLDNAVKFSHEGGNIILSAVELKKYAEVSITDTGIGMTESQMQNLFVLENGDDSDSSEARGTGLGLILCKNYIEKNSGYIEVISSRNKGTTFIFSIPLAEKI